jgi:Flp pilus assembly protein TadD
MIAVRKTSRSTAFGFVAGSALAIALLTGCAGSNNADRVASASDKAQGASTRDADRGVLQAEKSVEKQPGDATLRIGLGQAYMRAGRFESAISAFNDALELGDENPRTALSLALANIAIGRNDEAVAILNDWGDQLQQVDLGLAYSLAGEARRGTAVLADAVRTGAPTVQARQNFAYALALDGRWREARVVLSQDLAPEMINDRIGEWAALTSQGNSRVRVAALLGTQVRTDAGQPEYLALAAPSAAQPAEAMAPDVAAPAALAEAAPAAPIPLLAAAEPAPSEASVAAAPQFEAAFVQPGFVSMPVVQAIPASVAWEPRARTQRKPASTRSVAANGTHVVQLGSFTSEQGARNAWAVYTARNTGLRNYRMAIIPATVNGKSYYRVAAAGFDAGTARSMCGSIKSRGGACLAYANTTSVPGDRGGPLLARRR